MAQLGLKYVHNDTCYPALLVIGQFLDALNSGKYDLEHTALLITQTGGGCRASNYIHLLRKALVKAGYPADPGGQPELLGSGKRQRLPDDSAAGPPRAGLRLLRRHAHAPCATRRAPYENEKGSADKLVDKLGGASGPCPAGRQGLYRQGDEATLSALIAPRLCGHPRYPGARRCKVGVVGEIYVKYCPLGNNDLEKFLDEPGLRGQRSRA